jgi:hypothetical protein
MDAMTRAAPPPGSAQPGDLYVDLQTRTLWLGVDPSVDPAAFILISDIVKLMDDIDGAVIESKAYTDQQITTRAPINHTHTSAQITDFTAAVTAIASNIPALRFTRGMIMQWSGSLSEIGVGDLADWALCNGANGTPDLRDKFVLGAGSRLPGSVTTAPSFNVSAGGAHIHTINATVLSVANLPSHNHGGITGYISHNHQHYVSGGTDGQGNHQHGCSQDAYPIPSEGGWSLRSAGSSTARFLTSVAGYHGHNFAAWSGGVSENHYHAIPAEGSNVGHAHTMVGGGGVHSDHAITTAQLRETIPFYALAFIMKL